MSTNFLAILCKSNLDGWLIGWFAGWLYNVGRQPANQLFVSNLKKNMIGVILVIVISYVVTIIKVL